MTADPIDPWSRMCARAFAAYHGPVEMPAVTWTKIECDFLF